MWLRVHKPIAKTTSARRFLSAAANRFDLVVLGGGSGGLALSKEAAALGKKVAVVDFVTPTPHGTTWGIGGTCVNVGCIPKKLMHQSSLFNEYISDATSFGWNLQQDGDKKPEHDWSTLVHNIQMYIKSLNFGYRAQLIQNKIQYFNAFGTFIDRNTIETTNKKGEKVLVTGDHIAIVVGGRPSYIDIPGAEHAISSDDIFSLTEAPGKTLVVGGSYISLECAGFLTGLGYETTVMNRTHTYLRSFDQQMSGLVTNHMTQKGTEFLSSCQVKSIKKISDKTLSVEYSNSETQSLETRDFNTVLFAVGRDANIAKLNLPATDVETCKTSGKIVVDEHEVAQEGEGAKIYAIGDCAQGRPELTPSAIKAGKLLARRLFGNKTTLMDYVNVPTTVFTPIEYGCVGMSEEDAIELHGDDDVEVYHSNVNPLEWELPQRDHNVAYCKVICQKSKNEQVVGLHYFGPNAAEVTQGFAVAMKLGATKSDLEDTVGIHPSCAEEFCLLPITKKSGLSPEKTGC